MAAPKKNKPVALDPVVEAQNLLLEIEQAHQDIADDKAADMVRAVAEQAAIMKANTKRSNDIRGMNIHMAGQAIKLSEELVKQCKCGEVVGRYKQLLDLMFSFLEEDKEAAKKLKKK